MPERPRSKSAYQSVAAALAVAIVVSWPGCEPLASAGFQEKTPSAPAIGPVGKSLFDRVRANVLKDNESWDDYEYLLTRRTYETSALGKLSNGPEKTYEVVASPYVPGRMYRRLVAVDGRPLSADELRKQDEEHRRNASSTRDRPADPLDDRRGRDPSRQERDRRRIEDVERVFRLETAGHEVVNGKSLLIVTLTPRPDAATRSDVGGPLKKMTGKAWVDEGEGQLVKIEMTITDAIQIGLGVIGRIHEGSRAMYRRAPIADGVWLPVEARFEGTGKTLVFRSFSIQTYARYSDFRPLAPSRTSAAR